jgi:hypothetical protein
MVRKKMSEQSNGQCLGSVSIAGFGLLIANLLMPLPTGITPALVGIGLVFLVTFLYLAVRQNPNASSGSSQDGSHTPNPPTIKPKILCSQCNFPVEPDQEFCQQCGHNLKQG